MLDRANPMASSPSPLGTPVSPAPEVGGHEDLLSLSALRAILWRQRLTLFGVIGAVLLGALVLTLLMTPIYRATATVHMNPQGQQLLEGQEFSTTSIPVNEIDRQLDTLIQVIASRSMALRVVDSLKLDSNAAFLGEAAKQERPQGMSAGNWREQRRQLAASILMGGVSTQVPLNTRILAITYSSPDPNFAARVANSYAQNFLSDGINRTAEANAFARTYLEQQIAQTQEELRNAELAANSYARANRLVGQPLGGSDDSGESGAPQTLSVANLGNVNTQFSEARGRRIAAEQRWRSVAGVPDQQLPEVQQNAAVQALQAQVTQASSELSDLRERYRDDYPQVRELRAQLTNLEQRLDRTRSDIKSALRQDYEIAVRQEQALQAELDKVANATLDEQDRRVQLNLIDRDVGAKREQLQALLSRYNQISSAANIQANNVTLLDNASVPGAPYSPNLMRNLLIGLVLGVGLAVSLAILREIFDDRLRSIEDVERKLRLPALGQTPHAGEDVTDELTNPFSPLSEAYSSIRATLDFALPAGGHHVIQFTSSNPMEGKTTSAMAIAQKYASLGRKVLIVDMDLRRPALNRIVDNPRSRGGVVDVLYGRVPLEKAMHPTEHENLSALLVGEIPQNPVEILSSGLLPEFIQKHRSQFDMMIIDSSPVMGLADAPLLSRFVDGVVFVVEANRAHFGQTRVAVRRLRDTHARLIGAIVTKFRALEAGQAYDYRYTYYTYNQEKA